MVKIMRYRCTRCCHFMQVKAKDMSDHLLKFLENPHTNVFETLCEECMGIFTNETKGRNQ